VPNLPIPDADPATKAEIIDWLERFFVCVREVDFKSAYPFWHDNIVIFGTFQELVRSRQAWTDTQWSNVWPRTKDFTLDAKNTEVLLSGDGSMAVAILPWTSTGWNKDGTEFDRPGRATIVLQKQPDGRWLGVHSHMSLGRGVPTGQPRRPADQGTITLAARRRSTRATSGTLPSGKFE
jgi:ketosteroid isomerase-like protein